MVVPRSLERKGRELKERVMRCALFAAMICLLSSSISMAQSTSVTVSAGYSNIQIGHNQGLWYERNGGYVDGDVLWRMPTRDFPVLLGVGISGSTYDDRQHVFATFADGFTGFTHLYSDLSTFSLEARVAAPISFGRTGFFLLPKLGAGLLVDSYSIDNLNSSSGTTFIDTENHDGAAFALRPALQAGYSWGWGSAGAEMSYMLAWGDFGRLGTNALEFRAGVFIRFRF